MFNRHYRKLLLFLLTSLLLAVVGYGSVEVQMACYLVGADPETGEETLIPADTAQPGDRLEYVIVAVNNEAESVSGLELIGPIPGPTKLLADWYYTVLDFLKGDADAPYYCVIIGSDGDEEAVYMTLSRLPEFSTDDGENYAPPPVTYEKDGKTIKATADMFTHIRWRIAELSPEETVRVSYRVQVP